MFPSDWQNKEFTLQWDGSPAGFWNFSASGTTSTLQFAQFGYNPTVFDCFQIVGHFAIAKYVPTYIFC